MKLIVGLGNVGRKYENTRHNVGFRVLDTLAHRWSAEPPRGKFEGGLAEVAVSGERVLLLWPRTLMNRSGQSVWQAVDFYKLPLTDLLVICDDFNLSFGKLRFRREGSAGGQKGLADIANRLGTEEFNRLRLGIGPVPDRWDAADFVLGRFEANEMDTMEDTLIRAADGAECWMKEGIAAAMNKFN
jgi:peptidyl-tRNA hydrolase, PTH1 family